MLPKPPPFKPSMAYLDRRSDAVHTDLRRSTLGPSFTKTVRMSLTVTLLLLLLAFSIIAFANWQERRKRPLGKPPLVSYPALQIIGILFAVLLIAHLVSLLTGQPLRGRRMP